MSFLQDLQIIEEDFEIIGKMSRDMKKAAESLSSEEARFLVDYYYERQDDRKRAKARENTLVKSDKPHELITWLADSNANLEKSIRNALGVYANTTVVGRWSMEQHGIGPVISAGLLAHIDINKAPTVGHIWSYAGLNPRVKWNKGEKRPWNATLKTLCWKIGQSFCKQSGKDNNYYGKLSLQRRQIEIDKNNKGDYSDQAIKILNDKNFDKKTSAYKYYSGQETGIQQLPPMHIVERANRWATKIFLSHWHHVAFKDKFNREPPIPYIIAHGDHTHFIPFDPNLTMKQ